MTKSNIKGTWRLFEIVLSVSLVITGLCLIGGCLYIYYQVGTYSRETVAAVFSNIAVPVCISLVLIAVGLVRELFAAPTQEHHKIPKAYRAALDRLCATRVPEGDAVNRIAAEHTRRRHYAVWRLALTAIGLGCFLWYALQPAHYTADINTSVIHAMWVAIPCFAVPLSFAILAAHLTDKSYQREIALLKEQPKAVGTPAVNTPPDSRAARNILRVVLLLIGIAALVYGFVTGGTVDVLTKAINICTECIGLG